MKTKNIILIVTFFYLMSEFAFAYENIGYSIFPLLLFFFIIFFNFTFIELAILKRVRKGIKLSIWEIISSPAAFITTLIIFYLLYMIFGFIEVTPIVFLFLLYLTRFLFIYLGIRANGDKKLIKKLILINAISFISFCFLLSVFNL